MLWWRPPGSPLQPRGRPLPGMQSGGTPTGGAAVFPWRAGAPGHGRPRVRGAASLESRRAAAARTIAPLATSFPFSQVFPLNSAAPASILAPGPPPAPPETLNGGRIRGLREGGSSSNSPQKASDRRRPLRPQVWKLCFAKTSLTRLHQEGDAPTPQGF